MSDRFGIPDHAPQHAPDHATQNPTPQGSWGHDSSATDAAWSPSQTRSQATSGSGSASYTPVVYAPTPKSVTVAIVLAMVFGPLGLFYASVLNGIVALFVVVPLARGLGLTVVAALGGRIEPLTAVVAAMWCITVPWAVIGVRRRNKKLGF